MKIIQDDSKADIKSTKIHACIVVLLSIALIICATHEKEIDSFFGYDAQENTAAYEEVSARRKSGSPFVPPEHSDGQDNKGDVNPTSSPTPDPGSTFESMIEPSPKPTSAPIPEPAAEASPEPTTVVVSTQAPEPIPTPAPRPQLRPILLPWNLRRW